MFGGRVKTDLIHESVVRANAAERRGTHATKTRGLVSGSGKKPWRQKGTGRARVGEIRNPLWRKGGTVFGPQPRSYEYQLPKKVEKGALRAALAAKIQGGALVVVDALSASAVKTKAAVGHAEGDRRQRQGAAGRRAGSTRSWRCRCATCPAWCCCRATASRPATWPTRRRWSSRRRRWKSWKRRSVLVAGQEPKAEPADDETHRCDSPAARHREDHAPPRGRRAPWCSRWRATANKIDVKRAVEKLLGAKVDGVRTANTQGKLKRQGRFVGRRSDWKKAYVTLKDGQKLPDFLEGA